MKREALAWLRTACGPWWTEVNETDPGVMLLEALIYGLTDLAYQARRPLERLLRDREGRLRLEDQSFHPAQRILAMDPVNHAEDAALLYAAYPEIHYVEFRALGAPEESGLGCHECLLAFHPEVTPAARARIMEGAKRWLESKRRLGERVVAIALHPVVPVSLEVLLQLTTGADPRQIQNCLYRTIEEALSLRPAAGSNRSEGSGAKDRLGGPLSGEQAPLGEPASPRGLMRWSEAMARVTEKLLRLPGVAAVRGVRPLQSTLAPSPNQRAVFALSAGDASAVPLRSWQGGEWITVTRPSGGVFREREPSSPFERWDNPAAESSADPAPRSAGLSGKYRSIQYDLPRVFGLADDSLFAPLSPEQRGQAAQLKGYLLVFEQLLADYLAQLARTGDYFSSQRQERTRFVQALRSVPGVERLLLHAVEETGLLSPTEQAAGRKAFWADPDNAHMKTLAELAEGPLAFAEHRQAVLDHLLARFGEMLPASDPANCPSLSNREDYLRQICELGAQRATAIDASLVPTFTAARARSGLEEKLRLLLRTDRQEVPPALGDLADHADADYLGDFYFLIEPVLWLSAEAPAAQIERNLLLPKVAFAPSLIHVVLSWTPRSLGLNAQAHVQSLLRDHAPAHLWPRFVWVDTIKQRREFLQRYRDWALAGYPSLVSLQTVSAATENVPVDAATPTGRLAEWLVEQNAWEEE